MIVDCVMLAYSKDEDVRRMTQTAIDTLINSETEHTFRVFVVETDQREIRYNNATVIQPMEPFNYNRFLNIGLKHTTSDFVILANNDLVFHQGWFSNIVKHDLDSASPLSPGWFTHSGLSSGVYPGYTIGKELCGWCIIVKRSTLEKIGPFDERFVFWCQDNDYAIQLSKNGLVHALVADSRVTHLTSQSHRLVPRDLFKHYTEGMAQEFHKKLQEG